MMTIQRTKLYKVVALMEASAGYTEPINKYINS